MHIAFIFLSWLCSIGKPNWVKTPWLPLLWSQIFLSEEELPAAEAPVTSCVSKVSLNEHHTLGAFRESWVTKGEGWEGTILTLLGLIPRKHRRYKPESASSKSSRNLDGQCIQTLRKKWPFLKLYSSLLTYLTTSWVLKWAYMKIP